MIKNKPPLQNDAENLDFLDEIKESSYFQWLIDNRKSLPYVFITIILLIAIAFKFTSGKTSRAESNYLLAESYFTMLNRSLKGESPSDNTEEVLEKLKKITDAYPELHSRYDGLIAQLLIAMDKPKPAKEYADRCLDRTAVDNLEAFHRFSTTTLLIADGAFSQALIESKSLKDTMLQNYDLLLSENNSNQLYTANLFAYNILRIAMLEQQSGTPEGEMKAWNEWKKYADKKRDPLLAEAFSSIDSQLKEGEFSLNQYINAREEALKKLF